MRDKWLGARPDVIIPRLRMLLADLEHVASGGQFDAAKDAVIIRKCILAQRAVPCLIGEMTGHPTIGNSPGATSELFYLDQKRRLGRTLSRWYHFDEGLLSI